MNPSERLRIEFERRFAHWRIRLPNQALAPGGRGKIVRSGWAIWYLVGSDEKGLYLDYYSSHRMTDDDHVRLHSDGTCESLPTIMAMRPTSTDPAEDARLEAEYHRENQRVARLLEEKGFGLSGDEPGAVQINRALHGAV